LQGVFTWKTLKNFFGERFSFQMIYNRINEDPPAETDYFPEQQGIVVSYMIAIS
jgi:hypothetical protein